MIYLDAVYQHDLGINDRQADVAESVLQQGVGPGPMGPLARVLISALFQGVPAARAAAAIMLSVLALACEVQ